jgi:adenylate cyclase
MFRNRPDQAIADGERAIALDPNSAFAYLALSKISGGAGKWEAQLGYAKKAMRLDPGHPEVYLFQVGWAYLGTGRYREGANALSAAPANNFFTHVGLAYAFMELGREQDARAEAARALRLSPNLSLELLNRTFQGNCGLVANGRDTPHCGDWDDPSRRHFLDDLRKAGLK